MPTFSVRAAKLRSITTRPTDKGDDAFVSVTLDDDGPALLNAWGFRNELFPDGTVPEAGVKVDAVVNVYVKKGDGRLSVRVQSLDPAKA